MVEARDEEDEGEHVLEENEASDDELEVEYQETVAMMTIAKQHRFEVDLARQFFRKPQSSEDRKAHLDKLNQKFPCAQCRQLGHRKDEDDCPANVKVVNWRKPKSFQFLHSLATSLLFEREQCATPSSLARSVVRLKAATLWICRRSCCVNPMGVFLYIFGPGNFACVADVCSKVLNLDNSVVRDCGDTQLQRGEPCTARCALDSVLGVGDIEQTFSCQPDDVASGTQLVCEPLPCSAPKGDSEYGVDVRIDSADEGSCVVSCANGSSLWEIRRCGPVRRTILGPTAVSSRASRRRSPI